MIEAERLTKQYGAFTALSNCTLSIAAGEVFGLLGPNGAGKTTFIRLLMGFLAPTSGRASIAGHDCRRDALAMRRAVAYLPGDVRLFRSMRGSEALRFLSELHPGGNLSRAQGVAERLQVDVSRRVASCSSGMRQKLALAAVFGIDTPVLILDEPTTHLDPTARREVLTLVVEAKQAGRTVLFSSHVLSEVEDACQRVAILRAGQVVHTLEMAALRRKHRIRATLTGPLGDFPPELADRLQVVHQHNGNAVFDVPGELASVLGWLATLPLSEVQIEPFGLRSVYDEFHAE